MVIIPNTATEIAGVPASDEIAAATPYPVYKCMNDSTVKLGTTSTITPNSCPSQSTVLKRQMVRESIKPIQLICPTYAKRTREAASKDRDSIKRLCSLVSGARATRPGNLDPPRALPGLSATVNSCTASTSIPTKSRGDCTTVQPGDSRSTDDRGHTGEIRASCSSKVAPANANAVEQKSKSSNMTDRVEPLGKRIRTAIVQDSSQHTFLESSAAFFVRPQHAGASRESVGTPPLRIRVRSKRPSAIYPFPPPVRLEQADA